MYLSFCGHYQKLLCADIVILVHPPATTHIHDTLRKICREIGSIDSLGVRILSTRHCALVLQEDSGPDFVVVARSLRTAFRWGYRSQNIPNSQNHRGVETAEGATPFFGFVAPLEAIGRELFSRCNVLIGNLVLFQQRSNSNELVRK